MLYVVLTLPVIAAAVSIIKNDKLSFTTTILSAALSIIISLKLLFCKPLIGGFFYFDGFSKLMLLIINVIYLTTTFYSISYLRYVEKPLLNRHIYFVFLNLFVFSMLLTVVANNLGLIWVSIEATTITSALLVAIDNDDSSVESAWRYIIVVSVGLVISLIGVAFIFAAQHTLDLSLMKENVAKENILAIGAALSVLGFSTKAGIFPMHTWLPDVHGRSIAPVSAIFSAILLPTALYAVYRVLQFSPEKVVYFSFVLGFLSVAFAAIFLVSQRFYKRMFAYSSMENMGLILMGLSLNSRIALLGSIILILSHALAKSAAFYSTGDILNIFRTRLIDDVSGLSKVSKGVAYNLIFASLAVGGAPPFGNFLGELLILYGIFKEFNWIAAIVVAFFIMLAFLSVNYKTTRMAFSEVKILPDNIRNVNVIIPAINLILSVGVIFVISLIEKIFFEGWIK